MNFNMTATRKIVFMAPAEEGGDLGASGAQDIESRVQSAIYGEPEQTEDPNAVVDEDVVDDSNEDTEDDQSEAGTDKESDDDASGDVTLASALGLDDDKLEYDADGNVVFNAVIDGKSHKVPMSELVKSYQLQGHVNNKSMALESERKEFHSTRDQAYQALSVRLDGLDKLTQAAEKSLLAEFQGIDWNALRVADPGEWAALQQYYQQRNAELQQIKTLAGQERERHSTELSQEQQAQYQQFMQAEVAKMVADNPTWTDQAVMAKDFADVGNFIRSTYGFTDEEIANSMDARVMRLIQDARAYHTGKKAVAEKKIPDNVPKYTKPGTSGDRPSLQKARQIKAQKESIKRSGGSVDSIAAALMNRM